MEHTFYYIEIFSVPSCLVDVFTPSSDIHIKLSHTVEPLYSGHLYSGLGEPIANYLLKFTSL